MDTPNKIIKEIEYHVWGYNEYWDKPALTSELRTNSLEALSKIESYCTILKNSKDRIKKNFKDNPDDIKMIVGYIIDICNDGTDRREDQPSIKEGNTIKHSDENNELPIERHLSNTYDIERIIEYCGKLKESIESEKESVRFDRFLGKFIEFDGCESGTHVVLFRQISKNKNAGWLYSGVDIFFSTRNNYGDGILINDVEDVQFKRLPYSPLDDMDEDEIDEGLYNWLNSKQEYSFDGLVQHIKKSIVECIQYSHIPYILNKFPGDNEQNN